MKIRCIKDNVARYLFKNKWQILIVILSLILGTLVGAYISVSMDFQSAEALDGYINNFVSAYNLQNLELFGVFKFSVYSSIKATLLMWVSGLWIGLLPITALQIGAKGYKLGFSTAILVKRFGVKGAILAITSALPQLVIFIPLFVFYAVFNINFAFFQRHKRTSTISARTKNEVYIKNLIYLLIMIGASFLVALLDAYVIPLILKPLCSVWGKY